MADLLDFFRRAVQPLRNRIAMMVSRAVVSAVNDTTKMQLMKMELFADEIKDKVERFQNYGFTSVPFVGAEGVVVFPSGNREHGLIVAVDDRRYRLKSLQPGEVALYSDEGDFIKLKRGKTIEVNTATFRINASQKVEINTNDYEINAQQITAVAPLGTTYTTPSFGISGGLSSGFGGGGGINAFFFGGIVAVQDIESQNVGTGLQEIKNTFNAHNHPGDSGGQTGVPNQNL